MIHLYEYQQQALDAETRHRAKHPDETRLAIVLPTGTGKGTILAERCIRHLRKGFDNPRWTLGLGRVLVLVHTDELAQDLAARIRLAINEPRSVSSPDTWTVGIVKAGQDDTDADVIVASVQTLANPERRERIRDVGLVIVDECHHAVALSYATILEHFGCFGFIREGREAEVVRLDAPTPALGFTATLERTDGAGLGQVWQNVVFTRDISWAVRKGYLVQPIGYRLEIDVSATQLPGEPLRFSQAPSVQDRQIADGIAPERIVEKWRELAAGRQTIVFAPLVRSASAIATAFNHTSNIIVGGWPVAAVVHGDMPDNERRAVIAEFKAGRIQVLVNAMVLTEGFDHPGVSCVIVARPTKSRPLFIQMAGRGLRRVPGIPVEEQDCVLITLADATSDICSVADLSDRLTDRKADGPLTEMEDAWDIGRDLEEAARHWTGRVDATRFDPIVARSSKVWAKTKGGHWFLPISTDREYVFIPDGDTSIYVLTRAASGFTSAVVKRLHADLPDLELAMQVAEDEATERGGDLGALLADRSRPWRKKVPRQGDPMWNYAVRLGLEGELNRIMSAPAGGKAGKLSDLIRRVEASRSIDRAVMRIKEKTNV